MISQNQFNELSKHIELFDLVVNHNYIPGGQNGRVNAVESVHSEYYKVAPTDLSCGACTFDMIKRMWNEYNIYKDHMRPLMEIKIPIVSDVKIKQKKQRNGK